METQERGPNSKLVPHKARRLLSCKPNTGKDPNKYSNHHGVEQVKMLSARQAQGATGKEQIDRQFHQSWALKVTGQTGRPGLVLEDTTFQGRKEGKSSSGRGTSMGRTALKVTNHAVASAREPSEEAGAELESDTPCQEGKTYTQDAVDLYNDRQKRVVRAPDKTPDQPRNVVCRG